MRGSKPEGIRIIEPVGRMTSIGGAGWGATASRSMSRTGRSGGAGGSSGGIGTLVTKTLLVSGEGGTVRMPDGTRGAMLRAYDKGTGVEVGAVRMPGAQTGSPMTYMVGGKQYLVLSVSSPTMPAEIVAYALP